MFLGVRYSFYPTASTSLLISESLKGICQVSSKEGKTIFRKKFSLSSLHCNPNWRSSSDRWKNDYLQRTGIRDPRNHHISWKLTDETKPWLQAILPWQATPRRPLPGFKMATSIKCNIHGRAKHSSHRANNFSFCGILIQDRTQFPVNISKSKIKTVYFSILQILSGCHKLKKEKPQV